jgi:hypothetical protein
MTGIRVIVSNPPIIRPEHCESLEGCKYPAQKHLYTLWFCNYHYYRAYRDLEMSRDENRSA